MKKLLFLLLIMQFGYGQTPKSIHQTDSETYRHLPRNASLFDLSGKDILPLRAQKQAGLSKTIFGFLPYWEYQTAPENLQYDLLSHIAAFEFPLAPDGTVSYPSYWPWTDVINDAHGNGTKVVMCVTNFETDEIHTILTNTTTQNSFFNNAKSIIQTYDLQGVNIDFENISSDDRGALLNSFMTDLTAFMHSEVPGSEVSVDGPAVNWGGWDFSGLAASCDYIFIMGYDFYGSWSATSGPCAPLTGGNHNVTNTVEVQYAQVTQNNPQKLILGVPYYGSRWETETPDAYAAVIDYINHPRYRDAWPQSATYGLLWDSQSQTPWYYYLESSVWRQVWFDTDSSLGLKYDLADAHALQGVGMWALGYDGTYPELWDELRKRYGQPSAITQTAQRPHRYELFQNYPNPFNPETTIPFRLSKKSRIRLEIYSLLGEKIRTLIDEEQRAGMHSVRFNAAALAGGVYFYKLSGPDFVQIRKMIILQ